MSQAQEETQETQPADKVFTSSERIVELNDIDKSVAALLNSAGSAIQILANTPNPSTSPTTLESQRAAFTKHSSAYYSTLSSIDVRLRRQVYALEEVGLIPEGDDKDAKRGKRMAYEENRASGFGPLDTSWLNARVNENAALAMQKELWAQASELVEKSHTAAVPAEGVRGGAEEIRADQVMDIDGTSN